MNTTITIKVIKTLQSTVRINELIEEAFLEFDRVVKKYTRFNEDSELSNLNRNSGKWVTVSKEFFYLIEFMLDISNRTNCAFDPTVIDFLEIYGYDKDYDFSKLDNPSLDNIVKSKLKNRPSPLSIQLDRKASSVRLIQGQKIDLGAVGKGFAIDLAYARLGSEIDDFLIDAGGDIRVKGRNEQSNLWNIELKSQDTNNKIKSLGFIELTDEALASSGSWARKFKQFHHLINPTNGMPAIKKYNTVFVKANTAIEADAWATALFIGDEQVFDLPSNIMFIKDGR
ncbi:MAG: FAD:protein FMN transferase [Candidatus Dojkabacteria bacterium]|nr:FAD:protein FMN transferase [Candidatus Dojkabacteria bacterium]MDQ7020587.1 FAD:protein FMN transferase [Candidatus Dojkabacteria bacterium]